VLDPGPEQGVRNLAGQLHEHVCPPVEKEPVDILVRVAAIESARHGAHAPEQGGGGGHPRFGGAARALRETEIQRPFALHPVEDAQFVSGMGDDQRTDAHSRGIVRR
jgi:hypothetical protein